MWNAGVLALLGLLREQTTDLRDRIPRKEKERREWNRKNW